MNSRQNNNTKQQKKQKRRGAAGNGEKPSNSARRGRGAGQPVLRGDYAQMLADPCNSKLVPGFYGSSEGYLARFHKVVAPVDVASGTCGAILWVPDYHCVGPVAATQTRYNLICLAGTASGATVVLDGYGTGSLAVVDPCYNFVNGTVATDARTLSACIRMSYLGQMATTQGMVGHIDIAFANLEDRIRGDALSIDSLFELSQVVQRTNLDPLEQRWTPSAASDRFRGPGDTAGTSQDFAVAVASSVYTLGTAASVENPRMIGFVWKGFASGTPFSSILQFDCYKNIEWRPQATAGISMPNPVRTSTVSPAHQALVALDAAAPGWRNKAHAVMQSGAQAIAKKALAYSGQLLMKKAPGIAGFLL